MPRPDENSPRLDALEESHAFNERQTEQLNEVVTDLGRRLSELTERLQRVESRLGTLTDRLGEMEDRGLEPPPHSAGPDIPRNPL
ncbi:MAG: SlyX family protein [Phycisphaerales bacterium JB040]